MKENIKIKNHVGTWYEIDKMVGSLHGTIYLMESELYGDEAANIIIDEDNNIVLHDVWNGFDDYIEALRY